MAGDDRAANDDVRERLAVLGEIAAEVAHELRNVLQVITASAYLAKQDPAASAPHILKIERNARAAHGIVDDLMSLARGEPAKAEPILLVDVLLAARSDLGEAHFHDEIEPTSLRVRAHAGLLTRLFHVLYENAVGVCAPRSPVLWTRARLEDGALIVEVEDDGPGIDEAMAADVFEPLVTGRPGGTGLGLALARRIAGAHGGKIALGASRVEKGATFVLTLPT
jgi:two-component system sensor histidine kinase PilS (NtrC family)